MKAYIPTIIGVIFKAVWDVLMSIVDGGENAGTGGTGVIIFAIILTLLGIISSLKTQKDKRDKWKAIGIHAAIWAVGYFGLKVLVVLVIILIFAVVVTKGGIITGILDAVSQVDIEKDREEEERERARKALESKRQMVKEEAMKQFDAHGSEVTVNSTGDRVKVNDEWKKVIEK